MLIRGFGHAPGMGPYGPDDAQVRPDVIDEVPATLRPFPDEPASVHAAQGRPTRSTAGRTALAERIRR
ncbi:hypothetical protein [Streptomyces sp. NPDC002467]|uniref:hypothetical protein n=1 Tax=Streptomyces sp. NPDC002467 TaxID=3364647 RepID=UPI00367D3031